MYPKGREHKALKHSKTFNNNCFLFSKLKVPSMFICTTKVRNGP